MFSVKMWAETLHAAVSLIDFAIKYRKFLMWGEQIYSETKNKVGISDV